MVRFHKYLKHMNDIQVTDLLKHQQAKVLYLEPKQTERYLTDAGTTDDVNETHPTTATKKNKNLKCKYMRDFEN